MDVIKGNFETALTSIETLLTKGNPAFISLDCEFTGIKGRPEFNSDTPDERYEKMRFIASKFNIIQLGITVFLKTETGYLAYPYNIWTFPEDAPGMNTMISMDADTANFHRQMKLDFNKWIYEGVGFLNERAEKMLMSRISDDHADDQEELKLTEEDTAKVKSILENIKVWYEKKSQEEHTITGLNPFLRKYMYQRLMELYPTLYVESRIMKTGAIRGKAEKDIVLLNLSEEAKTMKIETKKQEEVNGVKKRAGVRRLIQVISQSKVPIIGHNPIFDLLFIYSHFQEDLPRTLAEFKTKITGLFPTLYDTMLVFSEEKVQKLLPAKQSKSLEGLFIFLSSQMKSPVPCEISFGIPDAKYAKDDHFHEAGFDSYITGFCFAKLQTILSNDELSRNKNKVSSFRSPFDFNFVGKEELHADITAYYAHLQEGKTYEDVTSKIVEFKETIFTSSIEEQLVYIVVKKRDTWSKAEAKLRELSGSVYVLTDWAKYVEEKKMQMVKEEANGGAGDFGGRKDKR